MLRLWLCGVAIPWLLGLAAMAAIVLPGNDLSLTRLAAGGAALVAIAVGGAFLGTRHASPRSGPKCERCGKRTGKPYLYNNPRTAWRCDACEQVVTDILFDRAAGRRTKD